MNEPISCNVADFFYSKSTQRKIGYSKGTPRTLQGHSKVTPREREEQLGIRALKALGLLDTQALGHLKGTWALRQSGTRGTLFSRLAFLVLDDFLASLTCFNLSSITCTNHFFALFKLQRYIKTCQIC